MNIDEKILNKILSNVHDKNAPQREWELPQPDKGHLQKLRANIILYGERLNSFLPRSG